MFYKLKEWCLLKASSIVRLLRGEVSTASLIKQELTVGSNFSRQGGIRIDASYPFLIEIGDDVGFSTNITVLAHDNSLKRFIGIAKIGRVKIGNHVMVGASSTILPNVRIGNNVIIGAGSVVTKDIPDNVVCAGNPAKIICTLDEYINEYINKYNAKITEENLLGRDFTPLNLDIKKKKRMKELTTYGFCYMKSENYDDKHQNK